MCILNYIVPYTQLSVPVLHHYMVCALQEKYAFKGITTFEMYGMYIKGHIYYIHYDISVADLGLYEGGFHVMRMEAVLSLARFST